jgi:hypothetical protein
MASTVTLTPITTMLQTRTPKFKLLTDEHREILTVKNCVVLQLKLLTAKNTLQNLMKKDHLEEPGLDAKLRTR